MSNARKWDPAEHYQQQAVAEDYDRTRFASPAGRLFNWLEKRLICRAFADLAGDAVIGDVPCGTGRLAEALLECGRPVVGLDISAAMLEVARRRLARFGPRFRARLGDARDLQESGLLFDGVLCARVLMHFPLAEQIVFLRALAATSRGRVVFTQGLDTPYHRARRLLKRLLHHQRPAAFPLTPGHLRVLLKEAGLKEIRRYHVLPLVSEAVVVVCCRTSWGA